MTRSTQVGVLVAILLVAAASSAVASPGTATAPGGTDDGRTASAALVADNDTESDSLSLDPATVEAGEMVTVRARITNVGDVIGEQAISVFVAGELRDSQQLELGADDSATVTFDVSTEGLAPGNYTVRVQTDDDAGSATLRVVNATEPSVDDYRDGTGSVSLSGLSRAVEDWAAGDIDLELLASVVDAWAAS